MARTEEQLKALHVALWQWLADNPDMRKPDWPEWQERYGRVAYAPHYCFACEAATTPMGKDCKKCPCEWGVVHCDDNDAAFMKWVMATRNMEDRTKYALQVKNAWK